MTKEGEAMPTKAEAWNTRCDREFKAGNFTRTYRDVHKALLTFAGRAGELFPSHASIAQRADCDERSVRRALIEGQRVGMLHWMQRRRGGRGRRWRTSNRYFLNVPTVAVKAGMRPAFPRRTPSGQNSRVKDSGRKEAVLREMLRDAAGLPDLLARRRAVMEGKMLGRMSA
jgi:hypothetical protein